MAASLKTVREKMDVEPTRDNKGLVCTFRVTAYDNGLISLNGRPVSSVPIDPALSWLQASEVIGMALTEFYRQVQHRRTHGGSGKAGPRKADKMAAHAH
jgi:hypothetical protein